MLERCANFALALMVITKGSIPFAALLWLIAKAFGSADFIWWIENLGAGFLGVALGLYLIFYWFLPNDTVAWEKVQAERAERYAALIRAMEQPEYWSNGSRIALAGDRPALLASLRAEGFNAAEVMTMANYLARRAVEKELQNHGFARGEIKPADVRAAERAIFAARADVLVADAKARLNIDGAAP